MTIFCGPSCVGKDTVLSHLKLLFQHKDIDFDYLDKYTTRSPRAGENKNVDPRKLEPSSNYIFIEDPDEFNKHVDIIEHYALYKQKYGFSKKHLLSNFPNLACIFGDLRKIAQFRKHVEEKYNRRTFAVLLLADIQALETRLDRRHTISAEEYKKRNKELRNQVGYIEQNPSKINNDFDLVIDNSDRSAIQQVLDKTLEKHFLSKVSVV